MPKFNFRLQSYLGLKNKIEDQRKQEYGRAISALEHERGRLAEMESQRAETLSSFKADLSGSVNPGQARLHNNFLVWLKESIKIQTGRIRDAEAEVEIRRAALTEAMKQRKMLDTLRDKDYSDFIHEQNLAEQKAADETVSFRHGDREN